MLPFQRLIVVVADKGPEPVFSFRGNYYTQELFVYAQYGASSPAAGPSSPAQRGARAAQLLPPHVDEERKVAAGEEDGWWAQVACQCPLGISGHCLPPCFPGSASD